VRHALEVNGEFEAEYRLMARDGAPRWVVARGQMERDAQGRPLRLRGVSVDVTERKQAEDRLAQRRNELAHLSRVSTLGQLASSLAHELHQPLGAILRNAEAAELFLQNDAPDLEEIRAIFADIRQDDQRAGAVIDRMRAMLKRRELQGAALDMNALVNEVTTLVRLDAQARKTQLVLAPVTPVPPVWADRVQLQQVVMNLLLNAMDAMSDCPPQQRRVSVSVRGVAAGVEVAVSDAGTGIPEENLPRVFDPFFTTKPGGLGMGLAISQTIIYAHGGRLTAENNVDGGATFRLTLPAAKSDSNRVISNQ
jgi:two-component system, LuxR family, sensor kinase FixL